MPVKYSKLSDYKKKNILRCFREGLKATQTSRLTGINRNIVNRYYKIFRQRILDYQENKRSKGEIELDESYFGGKGKGKRGRGTMKIPVFGILKRNGCDYIQIIKNATKSQVLPIIRKYVKTGSTVYTDEWIAYDGLVVDGYKHYRINHQNQEYSNKRGNHINGIENFWSFAKRRLQKFNGIASKDFKLHIKECEFRYNYKNDLYDKLLNILNLF